MTLDVIESAMKIDCYFFSIRFIYQLRQIDNKQLKYAFGFCTAQPKYANRRANLFMFDEFIFIQFSWPFDG